MKYKHALCLYPYVVDQRPGIGIFPPTGLEYVATALKGHVGRITLIDLRHERSLQPLKRMAQYIEREAVDLICISVGWRARYRQVTEFIAGLPADRTTIVGGQEASAQVDDLFERCPNIDAIVRGEGEQTIAELADGRSWEQVLGLSYRLNGAIKHNPNRPLQPVDQIVPPDRTLRRSRYFPVLRGHRLLPLEFDTILASRGCPYKCEFCTLTLNPLGQKRDFISRSPESVADEIESSPARVILFADDIFFLEPRKAERLCDLLIERGIDKHYVAQCRIEVYKFPRMLEKAYNAGFRILLLGIEAANDRMLKQLNKGFTTAEALKAFAVLRRFPFWYHGYFIYGNVGETEEEMVAIPQFARDLDLHSISLARLHVDEFTPLRQMVESTPGYRISTNGFVYSEEFDKHRLRRIRNRIRNDFQYRPTQLVKAIKSMNSSELISYRQMAGLGLKLPLFVWDYAAHRGHKAFRRLWHKIKPANDRQAEVKQRTACNVTEMATFGVEEGSRANSTSHQPAVSSVREPIRIPLALRVDTSHRQSSQVVHECNGGDSHD